MRPEVEAHITTEEDSRTQGGMLREVNVQETQGGRAIFEELLSAESGKETVEGHEIFEDSFESVHVAEGKAERTARLPAWYNAAKPDHVRLVSATAGGDWQTPHGQQAVRIGAHSPLETSPTVLKEPVVAGYTYILSFNVAAVGKAGNYRVELSEINEYGCNQMKALCTKRWERKTMSYSSGVVETKDFSEAGEVEFDVINESLPMYTQFRSRLAIRLISNNVGGLTEDVMFDNIKLTRRITPVVIIKDSFEGHYLPGAQEPLKDLLPAWINPMKNPENVKLVSETHRDGRTQPWETPFGEQAIQVYGYRECPGEQPCGIESSPQIVSERIQPGSIYTLTFNVAAAKESGDYRVELSAVDEHLCYSKLCMKNWTKTTLAFVEGIAKAKNFSESGKVVYHADQNSPARLRLAIRLLDRDVGDASEMPLFDNIKFTRWRPTVSGSGRHGAGHASAAQLGLGAALLCVGISLLGPL